MTASKRSMCRVRLSGPVWTNKSTFRFKFRSTSYYFDICQFRCGNEDSRGNENRKLWKKIFSVGKKSISILVSL